MIDFEKGVHLYSSEDSFENLEVKAQDTRFDEGAISGYKMENIYLETI